MDISTYFLVLATLMWVMMTHLELKALPDKLSAINAEKCVHHLVSPELLEAVASSHSLECTSEEVCESPDALLKRVLGQCMEPLRGSMSTEEFDTLVNTEWKKLPKVEYKPVSL